MDQKTLPRSLGTRDPRPRDPSRPWRDAYENALRYRHPRFFFVDEAQHLLKMTRSSRVIDQTDCLKSLISQTHVPLLLAGNYRLLDLVDLSEQLGRRSCLFHFPRYDARAQNGRDLVEFRTFVLSMEAHLPIPDPPDLTAHWQYLYQQTLGACGVLHDWIVEAWKLAHEEGETLSFKHMERTERGWGTLTAAYQEIQAGEERMRQQQSARVGLIAMLGMKQSSTKTTTEQEQPAPAETADKTTSTPKNSKQRQSTEKSRKGRPDRKPHRDPVTAAESG